MSLSFCCLLLISMILFFLGKVISKKMIQDREFQSPFECGFISDSEMRTPFSLHFFLLALIFLVFDVELIILFPFLVDIWNFFWLSGILLMILFLILLLLGLFNEWNQNILEWTK
uniref:NADH-ubiquinone oxidoreductase chain 3 n=1 Tax=Paracyclopina nana TaxID=565004 RepID=C0J6R8_PARNA|nr:NADH dehydrogenase subunit 3 [Paracyclopina nana]